MKTQLAFGLVLGVGLCLGACDRGARATDPSTRPAAAAAPTSSPYKNVERTDKVNKTKEEWKKQLAAEQFHILREKGTEPPFDNKYWNNHDKGIYKCAGCGLELFSTDTKFDSGTGWPSFWQPLDNAVGRTEDRSYGMTRIEVHCRRCGGHLGHVFDDGPKPTGLRYCIDGFGLVFKPSDASAS